MVRYSEADFVRIQSKLNQGKVAPASDGDLRESGSDGLQAKIIAWCESQWPRWKYIQARNDKKSTIALGAQDFTVFGPFPLCLCIETKSKTGKLSEAQRDWAFEMSRLGWKVHLIRSMDEFLSIAKPQG